MIKRIASAFLALLILISALPLPARAAAQVGDTVLLPAMEEPGAGWAPDTDDWVQRGCDLEGHVHDQSCVSADNFLICQQEPGTHIHDQNCGYYDIQYQWVYTGKVAKKNVGTGLNLTVRNVDPQGNPIEGAKFYLVEKGTNRFMSKAADTEGLAVLKNIKVDENATSSTWTLSQNALTGDLAEQYRTNTDQYEVSITKDRAGNYSMTVSGAEEYDPETQTVTFVNQPVKGMLLLEMEFEDDIVPVDSCNVTLTGPEGYSETFAFSGDMDGYYWQKLLKDLPLGKYTVTVDAASAQVEGYELVTTCQSELFKQSAVESASIELTAACTAGTLTIHNRYKKAMPKTVQVRTEDTLGNLLGGAEVGIFLRETSTGAMEAMGDTDGDGMIELPVNDYLADVYDLLDEGESRTVYLKQTVAPEGYEISETVFALTASKVNGDLLYEIPGSTIEGDVMKLAFTHPAKTGTVEVKMAFANDVIPEGITAIPVTVTGGTQSKELTLSAENGWKAQVQLPLGSYTVQQKDDAAQAEDYTLNTTYENQNVTLENDGDSVTCTITNQYYAPSNMIIARTVDEQGTLLWNVEYRLLDESGTEVMQVKSESGEAMLDLESLAQPGQTMIYTLCSDKYMPGYQESQEQYQITVKESNGRVTVKSQKDANVFVRLFNSGKAKGDNGEQVLTFTCEAIRGDVTFKVTLAGDVPPVDRFGVELKSFSNVPMDQKLEFTAEGGWTLTLEDIPMGWYYFFSVDPIEGYELKNTTYQVIGGEMVASTLELDEAAESATVNITYTYEKEITQEIPEQVTIRTKDTSGKLLPGAEVGIFLRETSTGAMASEVDSDNDGLITINVAEYLEDAAAALDEGKSKTVWLKQTIAPQGYDLSETAFALTASKKNGQLTYDIPGAEMADGTMYLDFVHEAIPEAAPFNLNIEMTVKGDYKPEMIPLTVTGEKGQETFELSASNNWSVKRENLARGTYTVTQEAAVEGYQLIDEIWVDGGKITEEGVLTVDTDASEVTLTIVNTYKKEKLDTLVIHFRDDLGNPLPGGKVGLFFGQTKLREVSDNDDDGIITIDNLEELANDVESMLGGMDSLLNSPRNLTLKQTVPPIGMEGKEPVTGEFTVTVQKINGELQYAVAGTTPKNGTVELTMEHEADKGTLHLEAVFTDGLIPEMLTSLKVTATDSSKKSYELTLTKEGGWKADKLLPVGIYTVTMDAESAKADGYTVKTSYEPKTRVVKLEKDKTGTCVITNTYTKEASTGNLSVQLRFVDEAGSSMMSPANAKINISGDGVNETRTLTYEDTWKTTLENLPLGRYTVSVDSESVQIMGYTLKSSGTCQVELTQNGKTELVEIENRYEVSNPDNMARIKVKINFENDIKPVMAFITIKDDTYGLERWLVCSSESNWEDEWQLPLDSYTVSMIENASINKVSGYKLTTTYDKSNKVVLDKAGEIELVTINARYVKTSSSTGSTTPTTPKVEANGQMIIRTVDERGALWGGANYGLFYGSTELRSFTDYGTGAIHVDDPELVMGIYANQMIAMGAPLTLKQTKAPNTSDGICDRAYSVFVVLKDGKVGFEIEGAEVNPQGIQIAEFINRHKQEATAPASVSAEKSNDIIIRTLDDSGNVLTGAEYCLSSDQYFDKEEDAIYDEADRHGEIVIDDLAGYVENGKKATWYLMQSRQPENSKLSTDRFKVELTKKNNKLEVEVKKDEGLFDAKSAGAVEEGDKGEWIVSFVSSQKATTVSVTCNDVVDWNDSLVVEDILKNYKQSEYEFQLNWEKDGQEQEPMSLKLKNGETGSFEPLPNGARYEIILPQGVARASVKKGQLTGIATSEAVNLEAEMCYDIRPGEALTIDMVRIDAQTEEPLAGAVYVLKDKSGEEVDTYKTRKDGKLLVDAITAPGEYTLTETETPDGYSKIKKDIAINVAVTLEKGADASGNPVLYQKLAADVSHSMVKRQESGTYRIGTAQDKGGSGTVFLVLGGVAAAAGAAGAGTLLYRRRKSRKSPF